MLSVNLYGQIIPTRNSAFGFLHPHNLFLNKNPNFHRVLRTKPFPKSISFLLQSAEQNPQSVKDSSDVEKPQQEEEVELDTLNYLQNALLLSEKEAIDVVKRLMVRNKRLSKMNLAENADAVLAVLREHGFTRTQISMAVQRHPRILISRPCTISAKLEFFQSIGFKRGAYLGGFVSKCPQILSTCLNSKLIPNYNILKEILDSNHELIHYFVKKSPKTMQVDLSKTLVPNVEVLRDAGVPKSNIVFLVVKRSSTAILKHSQFRQAVIRLQEMGFDCSRFYFFYGMRSLLGRNGTKWDKYYQKFLELGCSKDEILSAFRLYPKVMLSVEKIDKVIDCLVNKMGWPRNDVVKRPRLFVYNLEKRIIPRGSVVLFLHSKGLLEKLPKASTTFYSDKDYFIKRYVTRYAEEVPEVLQIYKGEVNFLGK